MAPTSPTQDGYQAAADANTGGDPQSINYTTAPPMTQDESFNHISNSNSNSSSNSNNSSAGTTKTTMDPHTVSSTASHQHQQEQELLSEYTVPNPPVSTQQSNAVATEHQDSIDEDANSDKPRTLWMGDLDSWLDEQQITDLWWNLLKKKVVVKIIKPKTLKLDPQLQGLTNSGYCFVEFESFEDAQEALGLNGQLLPDVAMPSQQLYPNNPDNQKKYFRLNWASGATLSAPIVQMPEYSLFVGDLSASTTEAHLLAFFQKKFPNSIKTVRVMTDPVSGKSRCFGFVRFTEESERQRALSEMNGVWFAGRPLRVALATPRSGNYRKFNNRAGNNSSNRNNNNGNHYNHSSSSYDNNDPFVGNAYYSPDPATAAAAAAAAAASTAHIPPEMMFIPPGAPAPQTQLGGSPLFGYYNPMGNDRAGGAFQLPQELDGSFLLRDSQHEGQPYMSQSFQVPPQQAQMPPQLQSPQYSDPNNTTVFVGGLSSEVTEATLFTLFKPFGVIQQIKIPPGKNCGFVKYSTREEAERTIAAMQGFIIGGNRVRLSWGRVSMNNKKYQRQQQQVAQAAQMQVAAALSMGMDPASAIAAAAAATAGGFPPPPPPPPPPHPSVMSQQHPHQVPPHILGPGGPQISIPPPPQAGVAGAGVGVGVGASAVQSMGFPPHQYQQYDNHAPPQSSEEGESIDTSSTRAGVGTGESEPSYTSTPVKEGNNKDIDAGSRRGQATDKSFQLGQKDEENLIDSMKKMDLGNESGSKGFNDSRS
ncbi:NGR1 [Candida theae]|uniref:NGR1 n=1 Tax=Candida theae TaxID=1198502 RepID=A0AAD5BGK4_9ASCO|nr:NGR1 [Candida theae]KAI5961479.1 NGR1 [Candida theae]